MARRELDMMRPRRRRRAALREDLPAALVRAEQPRPGRALVHRAPHERVAEAESPRDVGGTHEPEVQELVERRHGGGVVRAGRGAASSGSNGSPATAAPRRTWRVSSDRRPSSSASEAMTAAGTPTTPAPRQAATVRRRSLRRSERVVGGRTGCRPPPRRSRPPARARRRRRAGRPRPRGEAAELDPSEAVVAVGPLAAARRSGV